MHKSLPRVIVTVAATLAITMAVSMNTAIIKPAFAGGGICISCVSSFTPSALSSGLSGTGAQATGGSASDFSPAHEKPKIIMQ
jgi:hypothetical protein